MHTPGPWRYQGELTRGCGLPDRMRFEVYRDGGKYGHPATCDLEADARLIATTPRLLAELKALTVAVARLEGVEIPYPVAIPIGVALKAAEQAIAEAEGK